MKSNNELKPVYDALNALVEETIKQIFTPKELDVGKIGLLIHRHKGSNGYCYIQENWSVNGVGCRELAITDTCLMEGITQIQTTLTHELIHAYCKVAGIKDCSGKYHNKKFAAVCDKIGLEHITLPKVGVCTPKQDHPLFESILNALPKKCRDILDNVSVLLESTEKKKTRSKNLAVHQCPCCGAKARATPTTNLVCGDCDESMEVQ